MDSNKKIIFLVAEDTTPAQIIIDILKQIGISKPTNDIANKSKTPKVVVVNNAAKDFFAKKINEAEMSELFQKELQIPKENAEIIIQSIKEKLIPFGKIITIPNDNNPTENTRNFSNTLPSDGISAKKIRIPSSPRLKNKDSIEKPKDYNIKQKNGPDKYRETIE